MAENRLKGELQSLETKWSYYTDIDTMYEKYEKEITQHIDELLNKHKEEIKEVRRESFTNGDFFECYIISYIDNLDVLQLVVIKVQSC